MIESVSRYTTKQAVALALACVMAIALWLAAEQRSNAAPGTHAPDAAAEARLEGIARVVDGDTIHVTGERVRLEGIDAPEVGQRCTHRWLGTWDCGNAATNELMRMADGKQASCVRRGLDKYGRTLGICFVAGKDINAEMVRRGLAWAFVRYSKTYVEVEAEARRAKIGVWQAETVAPWDYRAKRWQTAETAAPSGCAIKGNVSSSGRIYHMPWSPWYDKVRMDTGNGKRWFCTEAEAVAAGWRAAYVR